MHKRWKWTLRANLSLCWSRKNDVFLSTQLKLCRNIGTSRIFGVGDYAHTEEFFARMGTCRYFWKFQLLNAEGDIAVCSGRYRTSHHSLTDSIDSSASDTDSACSAWSSLGVLNTWLTMSQICAFVSKHRPADCFRTKTFWNKHFRWYV